MSTQADASSPLPPGMSCHAAPGMSCHAAPGLTRAPGAAGAADAPAASRPAQGPRTVESSDLLAGQSSLLIHHLGEIYRLQTTRQGKLILTK
ncbi:MAG: hemin uptake protein HemP [Limnohabitans sp.]